MSIFSRKTGITALVITALGLSVLLTGCFEPRDTTFSGGNGTATPGAQAGETNKPDAGTATPEPSASNASCLTGSWLLRNETFEATLNEIIRNSPEMPAELRASSSITLGGATSMRFDGAGGYGAWQDDYTMTMTADGHEAVHLQNSADIANYEANEEYLWVTDFQQLFVDAELRMEGVVAKLEGGGDTLGSVHFFGHTTAPIDVERELIDGSARYECTKDSLTLFAEQGALAAFTRIADVTRN